jgi:hypothetical protein
VGEALASNEAPMAPRPPRTHRPQPDVLPDSLPRSPEPDVLPDSLGRASSEPITPDSLPPRDDNVDDEPR